MHRLDTQTWRAYKPCPQGVYNQLGQTDAHTRLNSMCHFGMCPCTLIWGPALWVCDLWYHTASCAEVWPVLGLILCYYYLASLPNFFCFLVCLIFEQDVLYFLFTLGPTNMEPIQIILIHSFNISFWRPTATHCSGAETFQGTRQQSSLPSWSVHSSCQEKTIKTSTTNNSSISCLKMMDAMEKAEQGKSRSGEFKGGLQFSIRPGAGVLDGFSMCFL